MSNAEDTATELVPLHGIDPVELYRSADTMDTVLARIEAEAKAAPADTSTAKGRQAITSTAYKIVRSKTFIDSVGKEMVADLKARVAAVDGERKRVRDTLDALRDEVRKPLQDWEAAEVKRKDGHLDGLASLRDFLQVDGLDDTQLERNLVLSDELYYGRQWEEYQPQASELHQKVNTTIRSEIARLAREQAIKEQLERERAALEAERAKLKAEADKLQAERDQLKAQLAEVARQKAQAEKEAEQRLRATDPRYAANPPEVPSCLPEVAAVNTAGPVPALAAVEQPKTFPAVNGTHSRPKYNELSESTFIQMVRAIRVLTRIINTHIHMLPVEDSQAIAKAEELRQVALGELKRSGITFE